LALTRTIPLPGVEGRIDHFAIDSTTRRLFVCALGNNTVEVLDLDAGKRIHSITGLGSPQGVVYLPESNRILVANDTGGLCRIYDGKTCQQLTEIDLKDDADNVRYDETAKKIYIGFGNGGIAILDSHDGKKIGSIKLPGHPEAFELEKNGPRIFVNLPNSREVAVVNREKREIIATWKTGLALGNYPMALNEADHRLFVGCRSPSKLLVFDTNSGEIVTKIDTSSDPDDLFYDSKRHRIYVICGGGKIDVIEQTNSNYNGITRVETAPGARTGLYLPDRDTLLVAVPHRGTQQAEIRCYHAE
jgi:DNA-binding beta-propeller fold protein YncE